MKKTFLSTFMVLLLMLCGSFAYAGGLPATIQEGVILHCFDWKLSDIQNHLQEIKNAGFVAVQTSPLQTNYQGQQTWYDLYRPYDTQIGNYLGSSSDLTNLCTEAHRLGMKVIVDVVANHTDGSLGSWLGSFFQNSSHYHDFSLSANDDSRYNVTHGNIGMYDLRTEDADVEQKFKTYVQSLKSCGVDGIRWDAAKHIGLPSEGDNFWPSVIDTSMFNYGEILNTVGGNADNTLLPEYMKYMSVTDAVYSTQNVLAAAKNGSVPSGYANYAYKYNTNKIVYWGESHDTYCNDGDASKGVDQSVVDRAYALVASRNDVPSLYLSRPTGSVSQSSSSIKTGIVGSMHYTEPCVAVVNRFHNAMNGKNDYYTASGNVASITRKDGGAIVVNGQGAGWVSIANGGGYASPGTYTDSISGNTWTITSSTISGSTNSTGIAVLYVSSTTPSAENRVYFINNNSWSTVYTWVWDGDNTAVNYTGGSWPGVACTRTGNYTSAGYDIWTWSYSGTLPSNTKIIFNNGGNGAQTADLNFVNGSYYNTNGITSLSKSGALQVSDGIKNISSSSSDSNWYSLTGGNIAKPERPGIYIHQGKKVVVK